MGVCGRCQGELYRGDGFWRIDGSLLCENCLENFARIYFAPCRMTGEQLTQEDYRDT